MRTTTRLLNRPDRPALDDPRGIVVHAMGQLVGGTPAWEFLRNVGVDAHRLIHPDGTIQDIIPADTVAYHAGRSRVWPDTDHGLNRRSLGVELLVAGDWRWEGFVRALRHPTEPPYTDAQWDALVACCRDWIATYPSITWVLGHEHVSGPWVRDDPKPDPGPWVEWPRLWREVWAAMPDLQDLRSLPDSRVGLVGDD